MDTDHNPTQPDPVNVPNAEANASKITEADVSNVFVASRKRVRGPIRVENENAEWKSRPERTYRPVRRFNNPHTTHLKRTGESFLQDGPCIDVAPRLVKCIECRRQANAGGRASTVDSDTIFCRFYAFRRLRYTKNGHLATAGFSDPFTEPGAADLQLWLPDVQRPPHDLGQAAALFLLAHVGDQFCDMLVQENEARSMHMSNDDTEPSPIAWKRVVRGVRELCDVCDTSLFNYHWTCGKCGFGVCLDCYRSRRDGVHRVWTESERRAKASSVGGSDRHQQQLDEASWVYCVTRAPHDQQKLVLTQISAGDTLQQLGRQIHEVRAAWGIPQYCDCALALETTAAAAATATSTGAQQRRVRAIRELIDAQQRSEVDEERQRRVDFERPTKGAATLVRPMLADFASSEDDDDDDNHQDARTNGDAMLRRHFAQTGGRRTTSRSPAAAQSTTASYTFDADLTLEMLRSLRSTEAQRIFVSHRMRRLPLRIMTPDQSQYLYPDVPHVWHCNGRLLRLLQPGNPQNFRPFQEQWKRGQPVIVSGVSAALNAGLWCPESFSRDFGEQRNDLVNCVTGCLVPNQPMCRFWDGFDAVRLRLRDAVTRRPMLLKLKDWPPGEDFADTLPTRFADLMRHLPVGDYTKRSGRFNLASRLPPVFVRPDLGPKMYNAYGSALEPDRGTTNLHLDISDAVNVMVYVGVSTDEQGVATEHVRAAYQAVDEAGCDIVQRQRVRDTGELVGAIWHIYALSDADKIRDLLRKVEIERGQRPEPNNDPIHDQSWYLDGALRERLYREYSVEGYAIAQCRGDAVFIPAGAPHQVRNLHNCIKVAEDFVSPDNVAHCAHLTMEFRQLSDTHSNREDKLQVKNIVYHAAKDAVAELQALLAEKLRAAGGDGVGGV